MELVLFIGGFVVLAAVVAYFIYQREKPQTPSLVTPEIEAIREDYAKRFGTPPAATPPPSDIKK